MTTKWLNRQGVPLLECSHADNQKNVFKCISMHLEAFRVLNHTKESQFLLPLSIVEFLKAPKGGITVKYNYELQET